ncbi:MAG TPA: YitT family protein [Bacteroidales bacterium]|nr:YitT family protein [Bacteroidales bacterium]HSA43088.1 YitT family protein [Bacteroidales bacterium]
MNTQDHTEGNASAAGVRKVGHWREIRAYAVIVLGLFINALSWTAFLIPSEIVGGGVAGISALIYFATGLPVGISLLAINAVLLVFALRLLGYAFGVKTVFSIAVLSGLLTLLQWYITKPVVDDKFMSAIIGGILSGLSIGMIFTQGGSTGGTDIIAMIVNKYRNISQGKVILLCDVFIIASSYLIFRSIETIVYGYVTMAVTSYVIDLYLTGSKRSLQVFVFSKESQRIADRIGRDIGRGVTFLHGRGWYTGQDTDVIVVLIRKNESALVFRTIKETDPDAFISVATVMGVYGKGFDRMR